jgi:hypothetical protein
MTSWQGKGESNNEWFQDDYHWYPRGETELAIMVSIDGVRGTEFFLPKSQIRYEVSADKLSVNVTMPEWLAKKKELL